MKSMRTQILGFLSAVIAAFALPGLAHAQVQKLYGLNVTANTTITSPSAEITLTATFRNLSPKNANSSFNSLRLVAPTGVTITGMAAGAPAPASINAGEIRYENLSPVGKDGAFVFSFKATFNTLACTVTWNPPPDDDVWTGSQINAGNPFTKVISASFPSSTTLTGTASTVLAIPGATSGAVVAGQGYAGTATVTGLCSPAGAPVTFSGTNVNVTPASATTNAAGVASFTATFPAIGPASLTANVNGNPSNTLNFTVYTGTLGCFPNSFTGGDLDPGALVTYVKASDQGKWGLVRGNNKDDAGCVAVPYIFDLNVTSSPQVASFIVPDPAVFPNQRVAAEYVVVWGRVAVDATGAASSWTTKRPKLSWGTASAPGPGDYVPALSCVLDPDNPDLASTFPNGFRSVPSAQLDSLLPVIPAVEPFISLAATHPQFTPGRKASMCIAQQGWTAVGTNSSGKTLIQYWTRVIDQADGFMSLDN